MSVKHFLGIEHLSTNELTALLEQAGHAKKNRGNQEQQPLKGQTWAMIFSKSSTRTRVSFEVGLREMGANVLFLNANDMQLGRGEPIQDTARVLGRMVHGAVIRTGPHQEVVDFAHYAGIPTINALTDREHPCQIVADLQTILEHDSDLEGKVVTFAGDGACNVAYSWIFAANLLPFELRIAAPKGFQPEPEILSKMSGNIQVTDSLESALEGSHVVYTDVWVSMGKEKESSDRIRTLEPYQINAKMMKAAQPGAIVMHCLPAYRGKEITEEVLELNAETIFRQAENRLHAQKAIIASIARPAFPLAGMQLEGSLLWSGEEGHSSGKNLRS